MAKKTYEIDIATNNKPKILPRKRPHGAFNSRAPRTTKLLGVTKEEADTNYDVLRLAHFGFSNTAIADYTGLTWPQVQTRISLYGLGGQRRAFRHGQTIYARKVMAIALDVPKNIKDSQLVEHSAIRQRILDAYKAENSYDRR